MSTWRNIEKNAKQTLSYCDKKIMIAHIKTTGFKENSKIIRFSARLVNIADGIEESHADIYINPEEPLSDRIKEITCLTDSVLKKKQTESVRIPQIAEYINRADALAGYNVRFLYKMLSSACQRTGAALPDIPLLDIKEMAMDIISPAETKDYKLETIYHYVNPEGTLLSSGDVVAAQMEIFLWCAEKYIDYIQTSGNAQAKIDKHVEYCYYWENPHRASQKRMRVVFDKDKSSLQNKYIFYDCIKKCWRHASDAKAKRLFEEIDMAKLEQQILDKYAWLTPAPSDIASLAEALKNRQKNTKKTCGNM